MKIDRSALLGVLFLAACGPASTGTDPDAGSAPFVFTHKVHSFSFENYTNTPGITNLTPVEVRRMFGDAACAGSLTADSCQLTPAAEKWMEATSAGMNGGHCEGMAVAASLFATGRLNPSDFGASTAFGLTLEGNTKLQREIAYWWATQTTQPTQSSETKGANAIPPTEVYSRLKTMFTTGGEVFSLGLYKRDGSGGHANTPMAVEERNGKQFIKVYENNFPNSNTMEFEIDPAANTWKYFATTNPTAPGDLYDGDGTSGTLTLTPQSQRLVSQTCSTCGSVAADGKSTKGAAVSYREVMLSGNAHVLISDAQGRHLGFSGGQFVNEIPGAALGPLKREPTTWNIAVDPVYRLPLGAALTVTLDGTGLTADSTSNVILTAPGYAFSVEDVVVHPSQKDTITFSAGTESVSYRTSSSETPRLDLGVAFDGADYLFEVKSAAEASGVEVLLELDAANGKLKVSVKAADGSASYDVRVERRDATATDVFTHAGNSIASTAVVSFDYAHWTGNGNPMGLGIDADGDGTVDSNQMVADDQ